MLKNNRIIRYIFSGGITVVVNLCVLYSLTDLLRWWYLLSAIVAFCVGVITSYLLQKFFTFRDHSREGMHIQFSIFFIYNVVMLGLNTLLMYLAVDIAHIWYLLAQVIITTGTAFVNYAFFRKIVFKNTEQATFEKV